MTQRYTHPIALERMSQGRCPECGDKPGEGHEGWGFGGCTLLPFGVLERIRQYRNDTLEDAE